MRVIAGAYKGRRLDCPKGDIARPTTDKVKEAMFGAIQFAVQGANVLDAFAGSGALGIEALSRGAAHVDFVERNRTCLQTLEQNLTAIGAKNCRVYHGDICKLMPSLGQYDIMLLDPPYDEELYGPVLEAAREGEKLTDGAMVVLECRKKFDFVLPMGYNLTKRKEYGDISLWFINYGEKCD
jgi:16S rRNA (guanine966-N2)-methyltransferase